MARAAQLWHLETFWRCTSHAPSLVWKGNGRELRPSTLLYKESLQDSESSLFPEPCCSAIELWTRILKSCFWLLHQGCAQIPWSVDSYQRTRPQHGQPITLQVCHTGCFSWRTEFADGSKDFLGPYFLCVSALGLSPWPTHTTVQMEEILHYLPHQPPVSWRLHQLTFLGVFKCFHRLSKSISIGGDEGCESKMHISPLQIHFTSHNFVFTFRNISKH